MKKLKLLLGASLLINILLLSLFAYKLYHNWFETGVLKSPFRESIFNSAPAETDKIYFVGDSHTEAFELNEWLQNCDVRNRGIWGDVSSNVLKRMYQVRRQHPRKIFFMIGVNDVCSGVSIDKILANMEQIVQQTKDSLPTTKIYMESVLPTNQPILHSKDKTIDKIIKLNEGYKDICRKFSLTYIDLFSEFVQGDGLKLAYSFDGLHLNGSGYTQLARLLRPFIDM